MKSLLVLLKDKERHVTAAIFFVVVVLISFFGPMDLSTAQDTYNVGLDKLVLVKLAISLVSGACACWGITQFVDVRKTLLTLPVLFLAAIFVLAILGSSSGLTPASFPTAVINALTVAFAVTAIKTLGLRATSFGVVCGVVGTATCGMFLFYFVPEQGIFAEPLDAGQFLNRMGGMAHPNSVARSAILATLLSLYLFRTGELSWKVSVVLLLLFSWTAYLAMSRTAFIAGSLGGLMVFGDRLASRRSIVGFISFAMAGFLGLLLMFAAGKEERLLGSVVGLVTKSGNAAEITSGTGRTDIWAEASRKIAKRPLVGYGFNAGPMLLVNHSQATHNAVMNVTMSAGIFGGAAMFCLWLWTGWTALNSTNLAIRGMCAFLFLSCLTEDTVIETFPGPCTLIWYICCVSPSMRLTVIPRNKKKRVKNWFVAD